MKAQPEVRLSPRMQAGVAELEARVLERFPEATFRVTRSPEDRRSIHLEATVDVDDRDEVMDAVIDTVLKLQIEGRLPIHVIPVRPYERTVALLRARQEEHALAAGSKQAERPLTTRVRAQGLRHG